MKENCILGALSQLDDFILTSLVPGHSGMTPQTFGFTLGKTQGTNEDDSQGDPHPEVRVYQNQNTQGFGPDD